MVNHPDQDMQGVPSPASKLVLPAPPDAGLYRQHFSSPRPEPLISQPTSPVAHGLFTGLFARWRKDPAYAVLALGIALVVISSIVFVALGAHALMNSSSGPTWSSAQTEHPPTPALSGTVDNKPAFPTPVTGKGSSKSSQPAAGPTPNLQPSPTPSATDQGSLSVQILDIPTVVHNGSRVHVQVATSEPGVSVRLEVNYDSAPFFYASNAHTTGGDGNATLTWNIRVFAPGGNNVQANVVVVATDRNGQQATSQPTTVIIAG